VVDPEEVARRQSEAMLRGYRFVFRRAADEGDEPTEDDGDEAREVDEPDDG
jgi:hypothetical protein